MIHQPKVVSTMTLILDLVNEDDFQLSKMRRKIVKREPQGERLGFLATGYCLHEGAEAAHEKRTKTRCA